VRALPIGGKARKRSYPEAKRSLDVTTRNVSPPWVCPSGRWVRKARRDLLRRGLGGGVAR